MAVVKQPTILYPSQQSTRHMPKMTGAGYTDDDLNTVTTNPPESATAQDIKDNK